MHFLCTYHLVSTQKILKYILNLKHNTRQKHLKLKKYLHLYKTVTTFIIIATNGY